jgi:uncharacterized membrane protein (DUF4010 family)
MADHYSVAVAVACTVMLPRVLVTTALINRSLAMSLIVPLALMAMPGIGYGVWIWLRRKTAGKSGDVPKLGNPLSLATAIKFAALYAVIAFLVKWVRAEGFTQGLLPLSFVSGLTDMDAISLSIARDHSGDAANPGLAARAVVLAAVSNTLLKTGMAAMLGSRGLKWRVGIVLGATALIGTGWIMFGQMLFEPALPSR